jgi:hypothetical protein
MKYAQGVEIFADELIKICANRHNLRILKC